MENRFNRIDGTAPVINAAESKNINVPKSAFDFSRTVCGPVTIGALYPVDCFDTVPSERIDINCSALVESINPSVRKLLNGYDIYVHAYYNRESDLWEGSKNFTTKGRSGQISGSIPRIDPQIRVDHGGTPSTYYWYNLDTVGSLFDWLGVPPYIGKTASGTFYPAFWDGNSVNIKLPTRDSFLPFTDENGNFGTAYAKFGTHSTFVNAIPFFMYQRLWRDKYCPKNLYQDNKHLFPDNEDHFIIPYGSARANQIDYTDDPGTSPFTIDNATLTDFGDPESFDYTILKQFTQSGTLHYPPVLLDRLRFRQYKGDDFTTASPFPDLVRGDLPDLSDFLSTSYSEASLLVKDNPSDSTHTQTVAGITTAGSSALSFVNYMGSSSQGNNNQPAFIRLNNKNVLSAITSPAIIALNAYNIFYERMGRTNGDYDSMIKAQFGFDPQNQSREARYLGGFHFALNNDVISQTSESASTPLGLQVVNSNGSGSGQVASFTSPDYGYIMILFSIVPDSWYTQGQDSYLSQRYQTDRYFPIFEQLGPEAIRNRELFVTGTATTDETPFGYAERGYRYKSRRNSVRGLLRADHSQNDDMASRLNARRFSTTPKLNGFFTTCYDENIDFNVFSSSGDYPFMLAFRSDVRRIAPMSEYTAPAGFSPASM